MVFCIGDELNINIMLAQPLKKGKYGVRKGKVLQVYEHFVLLDIEGKFKTCAYKNDLASGAYITI